MSEKDTRGFEDYEVEIEKSEGAPRIRILGVKVGTSMDKFDQAYKLAAQLSRRARQLDSEVEEEWRARPAKDRVRHLWRQEGDTWKLDSSVPDSTYRIALSLLRRHPACMTQAEVVRETDVPQKTVSNHLGGRRKSVRRYFSECDGGHRLSADGLQWVIDEVIPAVSDEHPSGLTDVE